MSRLIVSHVRELATRCPDGLAYVFVRRHDDPGESLSWSQLWRAAEKVAAAMPERQAAGTAGALLSCRDNRNFIVALLATWMRGFTAIPAEGGFNSRVAERNRHILELARPDAVLHDLPEEAAVALREAAPQAHCLDVTAINSEAADVPPVSTDGGGLLQFTSGSTFDPKPVLLSAREIEANCFAIAREFDLSEHSVGVHWLPLYHDMGLVGSAIMPLVKGGTSVIIDSFVFIQRPMVWLQSISRWRGTTTAAPNFACERLLTACTNEELASIDLSCVRSFILGGEPVSEATVGRLIARLGSAGLDASTIAPSYGMAEVTLLVSSGRKAAGPVFSTRHTASAAACVGEVIPELQVVVRDPASRLALGEGELGEITISGPSAGTVLPNGCDWRAPPPKSEICTGDYGYLDGDELYITGRTSAKLIIRGRNVFAEDIESMTLASQPPGRFDGVAAIGLDAGGSQQLCLLIELCRRGAPVDVPTLNTAIIAGLGVKPSRIVQLCWGSLPRTSSGKIRRNLAREKLLNGALKSRVIEDVSQTAN